MISSCSSPYASFLEPLLLEAFEEAARIFRDVFPDETFQATKRRKQPQSVIAKLERSSVRLSRMQDVQGFRIIVPRIADQEALVAGLSVLDRWETIDRRSNPSHGYRAAHCIRHGDIGAVEVQVRTQLQHQWADLSEHLDRELPGLKYGSGPPDILRILMMLSEGIAHFEEVNLRAGPIQTAELGEIHEQFTRQLVEAMGLVRTVRGEDR